MYLLRDVVFFTRRDCHLLPCKGIGNVMLGQPDIIGAERLNSDHSENPSVDGLIPSPA